MAEPAGVDDLYGLPLDEFTAARNALAKEVGRQGDKAAAAEIKRLPKPSRTAWALNQLARRQPDDVAELLEAGARLREAQQEALAGDARGLREASRAEQEHVNRLVDAALAVVGGDGGAAEERLRRTLRAAANDPGIGELLRRGRLVGDVEASGFGLEALTEVAVPDRAGRRAEKRDGADAHAAADAADADAEAEAEVEAEAERARQQAQREAEERLRAREAERLAKAAQRALERAQRLAEEAEAAERRAAEARKMADEAMKAAEEAQRLADDAVMRK